MTDGTMGNDDTDGERKGEAGRETFETVPPELRPHYVRGPEDRIDLSKSPRLAAVRAGLEMLDRMEEAERRAAAVNGSTKAHVAPVVIPQASRPRSEPPAARVEVSVPVLTLPEGKPLAERQVIQRAKAARDETKDDEATLKKDKTAASPWVKPAVDDVRASALPSSLRPRELAAAEGDAPASSRPTSERPAGVPMGGHGKTTAAIGIAILVVAVLIGARAILTGGHAPESATTAPVATMAAAPTMASTAPTAAPSMDVAPPSSTGTSTAEPAPEPTVAPAVPVIAPRPKPHGDDPYDAAAPSPPVTAQPQVTAVPSTSPAVPQKQPSVPASATSNSGFVLPD